jgi:hypothetical protein
MTFQEQAEYIMAKRPKCTAAGCPEKAVEIVSVFGKPVPYCKTHAGFWKDPGKEIRIYKDMVNDERKDRP